MTKSLKRWFRRLVWRLVTIGDDARRAKLTSEEMQLAFAVPRDDAQFSATLQVIDDHLADNVDMVSNPELVDRHGALAGEAGAINALLSLRRDLEARRVAATRAADHAPEEEDDE